MSYPPIAPGAVGWTLALIALVLLLILIVTGQIPFLWLGALLTMIVVSRLL